MFVPNDTTTVRFKVKSGFTIIELLVAMSISMVLIVVLVSVSNQALSVWSTNENKSEVREAGRAAVNLIGSEMRQAVLPLYKDEMNGEQFVINPSSVSSAVKNRDAVFWQAPIATSRTQGDLAIVGYFIRNEDGQYRLCRLLLNPDDSQYDLFAASGEWLSDALLMEKAPGTEESDLQGVFLENVVGMWVNAYDRDHNLYANYDSRVEKKLPRRVEVMLVIMDKQAAMRVAGGMEVPEASAYTTAEDFIDAVSDGLRPHMQVVSINVEFPF